MDQGNDLSLNGLLPRLRLPKLDNGTHGGGLEELGTCCLETLAALHKLSEDSPIFLQVTKYVLSSVKVDVFTRC